jgi:hypothetical protein
LSFWNLAVISGVIELDGLEFFESDPALPGAVTPPDFNLGDAFRPGEYGDEFTLFFGIKLPKSIYDRRIGRAFRTCVDDAETLIADKSLRRRAG